jgi:hypothetical protein
MSFIDPRYSPIWSISSRKIKSEALFASAGPVPIFLLLLVLSGGVCFPSPAGASSLPPQPSSPASPRDYECGEPFILASARSPKAVIRGVLFRARFYRDVPGKKEKGEKALAEAKKRIDFALKEFPGDSFLLSLLGEWNLLMVQYRGFPGGMSYGKMANKANDRALLIDPKNPEAHLSRGIELYFKPWFVGGSVKKALKEFRTANALRPHDPRILSWVGIALHRLHRSDARAYEQEAVSLCPKSPLYLSRGKTFNPRAVHP